VPSSIEAFEKTNASFPIFVAAMLAVVVFPLATGRKFRASELDETMSRPPFPPMYRDPEPSRARELM
jgi:hypothetical protein